MLPAAAHSVTPLDAVLVTSDGDRLPAVPLADIHKKPAGPSDPARPGQDATEKQDDQTAPGPGADLSESTPPSSTNPLFPPLPLYGPPSLLRGLQCRAFRVSAFFLSTAFLGVIVLGALFTSLPAACRRLWFRATARDPDADRPFRDEEARRQQLRAAENEAWKKRAARDSGPHDEEHGADAYTPTEGGPDPILCDMGYYARRVGLDVEEFQVQTEDGFLIGLWHVFDPREYAKLPDAERRHRGPAVFTGTSERQKGERQKRFPVLLIPGLLQSVGAYCVNDDDSLAFFLCKSGFDVWLGNNRCGFRPEHTTLHYADPRMWCWNIRQMGVFDLAALASRVLFETGFARAGLVCHSQGTTQTLVALAREQRPELGARLTVFCALAPAAYAGPLIGKMYFKFMRVISPAAFRLFFGIHAFIPLMMTMRAALPPRLYGWLGYEVFSFLFGWSDRRWDRALRDRMFQFAPVYVSAESMRWWLGRECFARHKCILATKEEWRAEEDADPNSRPTAWYDALAPPMALWVCGNDSLVDGERLLRRFQSGREPHVRLVHSKVIPDYEHLDVIWAIDAVDQVFKEVRDVLWKTCDVRDSCRVPVGCSRE